MWNVDLPRRSGARSAEETRAFRIALWAVVLGLLATNVITWRALERQRSLGSATESALSRMGSTLARNEGERLGARGRVAATALAAGEPQKEARASTNDPASSSQLPQWPSDPSAREALRQQQRGAAIQFYGELMKRWHLSKVAAEPALAALADHQLHQLMGVMSTRGRGEADGAQARANAADGDAVRAALSPQQLEELRAYDDTLPERLGIAPLLHELDVLGNPLSAEQADQLVSIMHEERLSVPPPAAVAESQDLGAYAQAVSDWQAALDQRIRDRAASLLPPDSLSRLETFQSTQRTAARLVASDVPIGAAPVLAAMTAGGISVLVR